MSFTDGSSFQRSHEFRQREESTSLNKPRWWYRSARYCLAVSFLSAGSAGIGSCPPPKYIEGCGGDGGGCSSGGGCGVAGRE